MGKPAGNQKKPYIYTEGELRNLNGARKILRRQKLEDEVRGDKRKWLPIAVTTAYAFLFMFNLWQFNHPRGAGADGLGPVSRSEIYSLVLSLFVCIFLVFVTHVLMLNRRVNALIELFDAHIQDCQQDETQGTKKEVSD